jgi:predicted DNA-binding protein with PD1-like motif
MKQRFPIGWVRNLACGLALASVAAAQGNPVGSVAIKLQDASGAVIPDAEVRVVGVGRTRPRVLKTDAEGIAHLEASPGAYEVTGVVRGFSTQTQTFELGTAQGQVLSVKMQADAVRAIADAPQAYSMSTIEAADLISPARPIPVGKAPGMQVKLVNQKDGEKIYAIIFLKGDEVLSGLTQFALDQHVEAAHFTGIGAFSSATAGWLDLKLKMYRAIRVPAQAEVASMIGDIAMFNGKPVIHAHVVLSRQDGSTVAGHLWEGNVNPTLEVFVSVDSVPLQKRLDDESGMKLIDPKQ